MFHIPISSSNLKKYDFFKETVTQILPLTHHLHPLHHHHNTTSLLPSTQHPSPQLKINLRTRPLTILPHNLGNHHPSPQRKLSLQTRFNFKTNFITHHHTMANQSEKKAQQYYVWYKKVYLSIVAALYVCFLMFNC